MLAFVHLVSTVDVLMRTWDWRSDNQSLAYGAPCFALDSFSTTCSVGFSRNIKIDHTSLHSSLPEPACWVKPDGVGVQVTIEVFSRPPQPRESAKLSYITMRSNWYGIYIDQVYGARVICGF